MLTHNLSNVFAGEPMKQSMKVASAFRNLII